MSDSGVKHDDGKNRLDLVPPSAVWALGAVLGMGAAKYGAHNWRRGLAWSRVYAAALRHLFAWWGGEDCDPESGFSHLWHVLCNVAFLVEYEQHGIGSDDRPDGVDEEAP